MTRHTTAFLVMGLLASTAATAHAQYPPGYPGYPGYAVPPGYGSAFEAAKRDAARGVLIGPYGRDPNAVGQSYGDQQTTVGPFGGAHTAGYRGGSFVNPDGSTVQYNTTYRGGHDPFGFGGSVQRDETMVTAPGGNAYFYSSSTRGAVLAPPPPLYTTRRTRTYSTFGPYGVRQSRTTSTFRGGF